jgi:hypothetical protein
VGSNQHSRPEDDDLALGVAVKPHACGVPLTRFQGLTAPTRPGQESNYAVFAESIFSQQTSVVSRK